MDQFGYEESVLDAATALYGSAEPSVGDEPGTMVVKNDDGAYLVRALVGARLLSRLQQAYREIGRRAPYTLSRDGLPLRLKDPTFDAAMDDHTRRLRSFQMTVTMLPAMGTIGAEQISALVAGRDTSLLVTTVNRTTDRGWRILKSLSGDRPDTGISTLTNFSLGVASLDNLLSLTASERDFGLTIDRDVATTIALLRALGPLTTLDSMNLAHILTFGYLQMTNAILEENVAHGFLEGIALVERLHLRRDHLLSASELLARAAELPAQLWPTRRGAIVRRGATKSIVDFFGASISLASLIQPATPGGSIANARAAHFEDVVQRVIDNTSWRPSDDLRSVRRRTLRLKGSDLTDLDAVGCKNKRLLIISCKGRVFDQALERGEYPATRNAQTVAENAMNDLSRVLKVLRHTPKGDNFDLSYFDSFIGVVCFPVLIFLERRLGARLATTDLRAIVTPDELHGWLSKM